MSTISVVIPVKNDQGMLEQCLRSLEAQTRPAEEVIVVDNGSDDNSADIARAHGARVVVESRPGITAAASAGYDAASGDLIARCDADSVLPEDWLARAEDDLARHTLAMAVTGPGRFYDLGPVASRAADVLYMRAYFFFAGGAVGGYPLFGSNFVIRSRAWRKVSARVPRDEPDLHDDFDLSYRMPPGSVLRDKALVVGISGRPFRDVRAMGRRLSRAWVTIALHQPRENPVNRWIRYLERRRLVASLSRYS